MSFDSTTRNKLAKFVSEARSLLVGEFGEQLQEVYGIRMDGTVLLLEKLAHLTDTERAKASLLREQIEHILSGMAGTVRSKAAEAVDRIIREQAFTLFNRFCALRLAEERDLVQECVGGGFQSKGFRVFETVAGTGIGKIYDRYKTFLFSLFDEISLELGVLFDRFSHMGLLFPRENSLKTLLGLLHDSELKSLWSEDETIGWIYQYWNSKEERQLMRKKSATPRDSRELAVRNQFFTPRYVVEFLTDNTLGRIWYEMRKGDTVLKEECCYLIRRPNEIFLASGEKAPTVQENEADFSQEELLKKAFHIEHRLKKDPRDLRVLDPACGSGHFLLYAFDLLERIYEEAWEDTESPQSEVTGRTLREEFETFEELRRAIPKLIIERNLHGIDIDPRAVQIAALALWLRAQKTWKNLSIKATERPQVAKSNIVTAEPMPGDKDMKEDFTAGLKPRVLGQLVDAVFEKMKLAGEAGSLLKIEEEIKDVVSEAKEQWLQGPKPEQQFLFSGMSDQKPKQQEIRFDFKGVTDEGFWDQAEDRILDALKDYSEEAENGRAVMRRLFAEDAARGFAFVDLCRKRYDVVLMNPPFGQPTPEVFQLMRSKYQGAHNDIFCSFVRWAIGALGAGRVGVITSRSFLLAPRLEAFRTNEIIPHMEQLVDFGLGVMDDAYVESAAYVLNNLGSLQFQSFDLRSSAPDHQPTLEHLIHNHSQQLSNNSWYYNLPKSKILYTAPPDVRRLLNSKTTFEPTAGTAREGMKSFNNERFIRLWWEINPSLIGRGKHWVNMAKGGGFSFFYSDIHLLLNWSKNGLELQAVNQAINGSTAQVRQASDYWYLPGATYSKRSARGFSARVLPSDCIFTSNGPAVLPYGDLTPAFILGWLNSKPVRAIIHMQANFADYSTGALKKIPWQVRIQDQERERLEEATIETIERLREIKADNETSICFRTVQNNQKADKSIEINRDELIHSLMYQWDAAISKGYGLEDLGWAEESLNQEAEVAANDQGSDEDNEGESEDFTSNTLGIIAYSLGCIFGRWEVRISIDPSLAPKLPDPFDPIPVCPPGMLVGPEGLPAEQNRIVSEDWLRARPDANTLPPEGAVKKPSIPDSEYPLRISWDGLLVDDPGFNDAQPHRDDIVRRVREVLDLLWKDKAHEIEQEACDILGVSDLRDYFCRPAGFFQDHLKRYSKSRRQAPIYWPLSTESGSYTLWIYYHRLDDQILFKCVRILELKINEVRDDIDQLKKEMDDSGNKKQRGDLEKLLEFYQELVDFRDELLRVAKFYKPDLNDGVIINAAPLWKLFHLKKWQKSCKDCWNKLEAGEYDWSHMAMNLHPDQVREKCKSDKSLAVAHGLEEFYVEPENQNKKGKRKKRKA